MRKKVLAKRKRLAKTTRMKITVKELTKGIRKTGSRPSVAFVSKKRAKRNEWRKEVE